MKIQKGDANLLICQAWKETAKESATITKDFNSRTCGICPVDRNAENYRDLKISMAVTPEEEAAKAQTQGEQVQRSVVVRCWACSGRRSDSVSCHLRIAGIQWALSDIFISNGLHFSTRLALSED